MFEISKFSLQKIWFANKTSKNLVNVFRKNMLGFFFSFLSLKLFLCSFWLYMFLKFLIWSTNLIKCTNSICTYLILALCQIGSLFFSLHCFHSFRHGCQKMQKHTLQINLLSFCARSESKLNKLWKSTKNEKKHLKFLLSYGFLNFIQLGFNVSAKKLPNPNPLALFCSFATLATLEAVRVVE